MDIDSPAVAGLMADVATAVSRRAAAVSGQVYDVILRDIPELRDDKAVLSLLASSVHSNVGTAAASPRGWTTTPPRPPLPAPPRPICSTRPWPAGRRAGAEGHLSIRRPL